MLTDKVKQLKAESARVRRNVRRDQIREMRLLHDAFVLYVVTGCALEAPTLLVNRYGSTSSGELRTFLEDKFVETPVQELATFECTDGKLRPAVARRTEIFFREWQLARWVRHVNDDAATAPGYEDIAARKDEVATDGNSQDGPSSSNQRTRKMWVRRWRRRWSADLGRVKTQGGGNVESVSRKAWVRM